MYTQRKKERRSSGRKASFPLKTKAGYRVEEERRCIPDRRLGDIHLELTDPVHHEFPDCLANNACHSSDKQDC
jgi:hypothetical protein